MEKSKILDKYRIKKTPSFLFFKNEKLIKKIEGYFNKDNQEELIKKINKIM